jgi:hypothetical protein
MAAIVAPMMQRIHWDLHLVEPARSCASATAWSACVLNARASARDERWQARGSANMTDVSIGGLQ